MQTMSLVRFAENKDKLMIYYLDSNGNLTQRIIKVLQYNEEKLVCFCYYRKQVRSFKIINILSWEKIGGRASA